MQYNDSFVIVSIALKLSDFDELSGSTGDFTYFRHHDGRIVQINRVEPLNFSQLKEIADQAQIEQRLFIDRVHTIREYLSHMNKNHKK